MRRRFCLFISLVALTAGCHPGPILSPDVMDVGGTIAGVVTAVNPTVALPGRKIIVVEVNTGVRLDTRTGADGGYTIKVPKGVYRVDLELGPGEALVKYPDATKVSNGGQSTGRNFQVSMSPKSDYLRRVS